jgi:predicted nucleic acid-binding Zn ribbon protein
MHRAKRKTPMTHPVTALQKMYRLASKRLQLQAAPCARCREKEQIQLVDWLSSSPEWKCRTCQNRWFQVLACIALVFSFTGCGVTLSTDYGDLTYSPPKNLPYFGKDK